MDELKNKLKLNKWFYWIPGVGNIIYSMVFELFLTKDIIANVKNNPEVSLAAKKKKKQITKYKSLYNIIGNAIILPFAITGLVLLKTHELPHFWGLTWPMWVGIWFTIITLATPLIPYALYKKGLEKYSEKIS